jgi:hypothetical protein
MRDQQNAVLDALQRVQRFLDENAALLTGVDFTTARKRLDEVVTTFSAHALDQDVGDRGAKGETAKQRQLRLKLRRQRMEPIAVIARRNLRSVPEFRSLQMPKRTVRGQAFNASARGMADAATIHKDTLVAHGLPSTFLDDLRGGIAIRRSGWFDLPRSRTLFMDVFQGPRAIEKLGRWVDRPSVDIPLTYIFAAEELAAVLRSQGQNVSAAAVLDTGSRLAHAVHEDSTYVAIHNAWLATSSR